MQFTGMNEGDGEKEIIEMVFRAGSLALSNSYAVRTVCISLNSYRGVIYYKLYQVGHYFHSIVYGVG